MKARFPFKCFEHSKYKKQYLNRNGILKRIITVFIISILIISTIPLFLPPIITTALGQTSDLFHFHDDFDDEIIGVTPSNWISETTPSYVSIVSDGGTGKRMKVGEGTPPPYQTGRAILKNGDFGSNDFNITFELRINKVYANYKLLFYWNNADTIGYSFTLFTEQSQSLYCSFQRNDASGWSNIGDDYEKVLTHNNWYSIMVIIVGSTFYGYINDELAAKAVDATYCRGDLTFNPTYYKQDPFGWKVYNTIGVESEHSESLMDDFSLFILMYYDDCSSLDSWTIVSTYYDPDPIVSNGAIKSYSDVVILELGEYAFYDLLIEFDIFFISQCWFKALFKYVDNVEAFDCYSFDVCSNGISPYQTKFTYGMGDPLQIRKNIDYRIPTDEWHHVKIVMNHTEFFGYIDNNLVAYAKDDSLSHGDVGFWSGGTSLIDNYIVKVLSYGDTFESGTIEDGFWDTYGFPTVTDLINYGKMVKLSYFEDTYGWYQAHKSDYLYLKNNVIGYSGYSIDFDILGFDCALGANVLGYAFFGQYKYNYPQEYYVLCLGHQSQGIRFQKVIQGTGYSNIGMYTGQTLNLNTQYHITIKVNDHRMLAYYDKVGDGEEPAIVAYFEFTESEPFGGIGFYNYYTSKMYLDNIRIAMDTDFDDVNDNVELKGSLINSDVIEQDHSLSNPENYNLGYEFVARYPGDYYLAFHGKMDLGNTFTLHLNSEDSQTFSGFDMWTTYILNDHVITVDEGYQGLVTVDFYITNTNPVFLDWIGIVHKNQDLFYSDIEDADDTCLPSSWTGMKKIKSTTLQWEFPDYDTDGANDNKENRVFLRTNVDMGFYKHDNFGGTDDWIWYNGKEYYLSDTFVGDRTQVPLVGNIMTIVVLEDGSELLSYMHTTDDGQDPDAVPLVEELILYTDPGLDSYRFSPKEPSLQLENLAPSSDDCQNAFSFYQEVIGPFTPEVSNQKYAVLISGGKNIKMNARRYYNNLFYTRHVLINEFGIPDVVNPGGFDAALDHIAVLYADGVKPGPSNTRYTGPGELGLQGFITEENIVDFSADKMFITHVFDILRNRADSTDELIVYVTDHGSGYDNEDPHGFPGGMYMGGRVEYDPDGGSGEYTSDMFNWNLMDEGDEHAESEFRLYYGDTWIYQRGFPKYFIEDEITGMKFFDFDKDGTFDDVLRKNEEDHWILLLDADVDGSMDVSPGEEDNWDESSLDGIDRYNHLGIRNADGIIDIFDLWNDDNNMGIDFNGDGDTNDFVGIDGGTYLWSDDPDRPNSLWDDELDHYLEQFTVARTIFILNQCYSGEFIDDLSNNQDQPTGIQPPLVWDHRIIITASGEYNPSYGSHHYTYICTDETAIIQFGEFPHLFFNALERDSWDDYPFRPSDNPSERIEIDTNSNDIISLIEAFNYASRVDQPNPAYPNVKDTAYIDDNWDESGSLRNTCDLPDDDTSRSDGYLARNTYI